MLPVAWAHPRSRGEHHQSSDVHELRTGSSPLARGTHIGDFHIAHGYGLIPARAGNTISQADAMDAVRAHPRSRGEHQENLVQEANHKGSSPLARGTLEASEDYFTLLGLIPARAGNTLADMGVYPLHQQNRITLEPEPTSRIHDKQLLLTTTSTAILTRLTPP